jgi:hypothetical protein
MPEVKERFERSRERCGRTVSKETFNLIAAFLEQAKCWFSAFPEPSAMP